MCTLIMKNRMQLSPHRPSAYSLSSMIIDAYRLT